MKFSVSRQACGDQGQLAWGFTGRGLSSLIQREDSWARFPGAFATRKRGDLKLLWYVSWGLGDLVTWWLGEEQSEAEKIELLKKLKAEF